MAQGTWPPPSLHGTLALLSDQEIFFGAFGRAKVFPGAVVAGSRPIGSFGTNQH